MNAKQFEEKAFDYFSNGLHCAEAVSKAVVESFAAAPSEAIPRVATAFGGGIEYHVSSAADVGASRQEILETTAVALAFSGGIAECPARFVFKVMEELEHFRKDSQQA